MAEFIFANKPAGVSTHSVERGPGSEGFVEYLSRKLNQKLYVCHRLDKETTGAIVFATTPEAAAYLSEKFASRDVEKTYWFLTDRPTPSSSKQTSAVSVSDGVFRVRSHIEKVKSQFVSEPVSDVDDANAVTALKPLKKQGRFTLWEAKPLTGKPHQIRLHAADLGVPILGDIAHGGSNYPGLMLHSKELRFSEPSDNECFHSSVPPLMMTDLSLCERPQLASWLMAFDRRLRLFPPEMETLRLIHTDGGPLRCDRLGDVHWLSWITDEPPSDDDLYDVKDFMHLVGANKWKLQHKLNRGKDPHSNPVWQSEKPVPETWYAKENDLVFEFRSNSGLSSGLFLDQRQNRSWISSNAKDKSVLNLFCYTAGFSVAAAKSGAKEVVSVDTSRQTLEWAKGNFRANNLDPEQYEFRATDSRVFLKICAKKNRRFDLIICDPPSFSRSKDGLFRIDADFPDLVASMVSALNPGGAILFSTNYEKWTESQLKERARHALQRTKDRLHVAPTPPAAWDYELPRQNRIMKSILLK